MDEYIALIEHLRGEFKAYNVGLQSVMELAENVSDMMEENTVKFLVFNQERVDAGLFITWLELDLLKEMFQFLKRDEPRYSGMNIEKGYYNNADALHMIADRWVRDYIRFYKTPWFAEPQQEESIAQSSGALPEQRVTDEQEESHQNSPAYSGILPEKLVDDMIAKGLVERAGNGLKWLKTKALLAYFAELASEKYGLGNGEYNGKIKTAWKPFETLFGINGLSVARNDNLKTGTQPNGYRKIDELFREW